MFRIVCRGLFRRNRLLSTRPVNPDGKKPEPTDNYQSNPKDPPKEIEPKSDVEIGGPSGKEPTRYGDWERKGRISDF